MYNQSGWQDLNLRRLAPKASALPNWATPRNGEGGIWTHGCFHIAGFQDQCHKPLDHLSLLPQSYHNQKSLGIKEQKNCTYTSTDNSGSFVVSIYRFINHSLTLLFSNEVFWFDFIHAMRHYRTSKSNLRTFRCLLSSWNARSWEERTPLFLDSLVEFSMMTLLRSTAVMLSSLTVSMFGQPQHCVLVELIISLLQDLHLTLSMTS